MHHETKSSALSQVVVSVITKPEHSGLLTRLLEAARAAEGMAFDCHLASRMQRDPYAQPMPGNMRDGPKPSMYLHSIAFAIGPATWQVQVKQEFAAALAELLSMPLTKVVAWPPLSARDPWRGEKRERERRVGG